MQFIFFFPLLFVLYYVLSYRYRTVLLLLGSYFFYAYWKPVYIILILFSTSLDFFTAKKIEASKGLVKRNWLFLSLFGNLGILFFFKYSQFFIENLNLFLSIFSNYQLKSFSFELPLGISFYTFQTMSYSIDVYQKRMPAEKGFLRFALYVSFFPQLVAGPIERASNIIPQLKKEISLDYERITDGLKIMFTGFFKKVVIADSLSIIVAHVYSNVFDFGGLVLIFATFLFRYQVFCDFSGYSDIAVGAAKVFGINLTQNFNRPFAATSVRDFWRRWHITMGGWFKDYVFFPLNQNHLGRKRMIYFNTLLTFLLIGLWHGPKWTYVFWGGLHGTLLFLDRATEKKREALTNRLKLKNHPILLKCFQIFVTFSLMSLVSVFFRASNVNEGFHIIKEFFSFTKVGYWNFNDILDLMEHKQHFGELILVIASIIGMEFIHYYQSKKNLLSSVKKFPKFLRWSLYPVACFVLILVGKFYAKEFVYFQF